MAVDLQSKIDQLAQRQAARQEALSGAYLDLVYQVCDDVAVDDDQMASILAGSGRSLVDLRQDVQTLEMRRKLSEMLIDQEDADTRAATLQEEIGKLCAERDATYGRLTSKISALACERDQLLSGSTQRLGARQELIATAWPHLKQRAVLIRQRLAALGIAELEDQRYHWQGVVKSDEMNLAVEGFRALNDADRRTVQGHLAGAQQQLADINSRHAELCAQRDQLLAELAECENEMLIP